MRTRPGIVAPHTISGYPFVQPPSPPVPSACQDLNANIVCTDDPIARLQQPRDGGPEGWVTLLVALVVPYLHGQDVPPHRLQRKSDTCEYSSEAVKRGDTRLVWSPVVPIRRQASVSPGDMVNNRQVTGLSLKRVDRCRGLSTDTPTVWTSSPAPWGRYEALLCLAKRRIARNLWAGIVPSVIKALRRL